MKFAPLQVVYSSTESDSGVGQESKLIRRYIEDLLADYYKPISMQWANPVIKFATLEKEWKEATVVLSSITEMVMQPAYQQIIGMGPSAIPLIFQSMMREPDHWFWALSSITGANPVLQEHQGKIDKMNDDWIEWGKKNLYL
jgi:hypothetical protein